MARTDVRLRVLGVDVSDKALSLARHNTRRIDKRSPNTGEKRMKFIRADVLVDPYADQYGGTLPFKTVLNMEREPPFWDILIANPPYISPTDYWKTTTRSVRGYEPTLALVPPQQRAGQSNTQQGDSFYPRLLEIARDAEAKIVLLEVADLQQALRVARHAHDLDIFEGIEIWRESPETTTSNPTEEDGFSIIGEGNGRSVLCWRGAGTSWLGKPAAAAVESDAHRLLRSSSGRTIPGDDGVRSFQKTMDPRFDMTDVFAAPQNELGRSNRVLRTRPHRYTGTINLPGKKICR
jgi:hypothetical protein